MTPTAPHQERADPATLQLAKPLRAVKRALMAAPTTAEPKDTGDMSRPS